MSNQNGRANSVNKLSLPNMSMLFLSLNLNMLLRNKVNALNNQNTVLKARMLKDLDLLT